MRSLVRLLATALVLALPVAALATPVAEPVAPALLPSTLPATLARVRIYAFGDGKPGSWSLTLSARPRCGANACFVGFFTGTRGGKLLGGRPVSLAQGIRGRYTLLSCGASCSPPSVEWISRGAL